MILSTEGDDWSPKSNTEDAFACLDPLKQTSCLVEVDLHNPVRLEVVKSVLPDVRSVCYLKEVGAAILC